MGTINGTFIYNSKPQNGAIAKLWEPAGFVSPPAQDAAEPDGGYKVGDTLITGVSYGGDGAFRWEGIDNALYISVEYDSHRAWLYVSETFLRDILTTEEDLLVQGASGLERLAKGDNDDILAMIEGSPAWA